MSLCLSTCVCGAATSVVLLDACRLNEETTSAVLGNKGDYSYICSTENMGWGSVLTTLIISIQRKKEKL